MPESLIPAITSSLPESPTVLLPALEKVIWNIKILWAALGSLGTGTFFGGWYLLTGQTKLRNKHDSDMIAQAEKCGDHMQREFTRSTDFATKEDVQTIHNKIDGLSSNIQELNTNVLNAVIAVKK